MHLFIDANIFLSFYHLTSEDIEELKKLTALIDEKEVTLYTTDQLSEEITRNRDTKISDAMQEFKKAQFKVSFPSFCKAYPEFKEIRDTLIEANCHIPEGGRAVS